MPQTDILSKYYLLNDHPFDPERDTVRKLELKANKISLLRELKMFEHKELKNYFVKVGPFKTASATVDDYLDGIGYMGAPVPPAFLLQGAKGTGMDSMINYIAAAILDRAQGATLHSVPIPSASKPRFLFLVKGVLEKISHGQFWRFSP